MITTRQIRVEDRKPKKLGQVTTKDVEVKYIDKPIGRREDGAPIFEGPKQPAVTTRNLADVADIAEKKRRDEIMEQRMDVANVQNADDEVGDPMTEEEEKTFLCQYAIVADDEFEVYPVLRRHLK